jgi:pyrroloquinoline quinone (PQQ) biosynthesis protein C
MSDSAVMKGLDAVVDDYCKRTKIMIDPITPGRARAFVKQHRLNTRQRNSVLKLKVATNCPDWDTRMKILHACTQEVIADNEFGHGKPHWQILEELGMAIGMDRDDIRATKPIGTTEIAWAAWEGLMANRHWLEGIIANACAERANVPGYGTGAQHDHGFSWVQHRGWAERFGLKEEQLEFWAVHEEADIEHSNLAWEAVAKYAAKLQMEEAAIHACELNLRVWELYFNGICAEGDRLDRQRAA